MTVRRMHVYGVQPRLDADQWRRLIRRAERALKARLRSGELTAAEVAPAVAAAMPAQVGEWLLRRLELMGWTGGGARVPFDVLDGPGCPADLSGGARELVRLALFGPAGQGRPADAKQRERLFQQLSAEVVREARDLKALDVLAARVLRQAEVQRDGVLASMLQNFLAERRAQLHQPDTRAHAPAELVSSLWHRVEGSGAGGNAAEAQASFERVRHEFDERLVQFDPGGAQVTLRRLEALQSRFAALLPAAAIERARADLARMEQRRQELHAEIDALTVWATAAAREGKHDEAAQALRRLSTLHASRPLLLSDARFNEIRRRIAEASRVHEDRLAAEALLARERAVAGELRGLAESIRRFHDAARRESSESAEYAAALAEYQAAVESVRTHDTEWLTALTLELDELLADLHDTSDRAEQHVSRFIENVREALAKLRRNVARLDDRLNSA
jgi:hypothetical protein